MTSGPVQQCHHGGCGQKECKEISRMLVWNYQGIYDGGKSTEIGPFKSGCWGSFLY